MERILAIAATITLTFNTVVSAAPGDLDPTFGFYPYGGVRIFEMNHDFYACCVAQQADGKLLILGKTLDDPVNDLPEIKLRRHLAGNGSLDTDFGVGGEAFAYVLNHEIYGTPYDIELQPDGKILLAGKNTSQKPVLWRFTAAGQLDTTFGNNGVQTLSTQDGWATAVGYRTNKILVVVRFYNNSRVMQRHLNGSADTWCGLSGSVTINGFSGTSLAIDAVSGASYVGGNAANAKVYRYTVGGALDTGFATNGEQPLPKCSTYPAGESVTDLEIQTDGKVVASAQSTFSFANETTAFPSVHRFDATGVTDTTLSGDGQLCSSYCFGSTIYTGNRLRTALQTDGKLLTLTYDSAYPLFSRLNFDGSADTAFAPSYSLESNAFDVLVQNSDGKIVVFGTTPYSIQTGSPTKYKLIRYLP